MHPRTRGISIFFSHPWQPQAANRHEVPVDGHRPSGVAVSDHFGLWAPAYCISAHMRRCHIGCWCTCAGTILYASTHAPAAAACLRLHHWDQWWLQDTAAIFAVVRPQCLVHQCIIWHQNQLDRGARTRLHKLRQWCGHWPRTVAQNSVRACHIGYIIITHSLSDSLNQPINQSFVYPSIYE